jgi:hypothetical protein
MRNYKRENRNEPRDSGKVGAHRSAEECGGTLHASSAGQRQTKALLGKAFCRLNFSIYESL